MARGEQMEEFKRGEIDCEAENCSFPVEVEVEVERNKTQKSVMLLCESHAELMEKGIPFKMRATKKDKVSEWFAYWFKVSQTGMVFQHCWESTLYRPMFIVNEADHRILSTVNPLKSV